MGYRLKLMQIDCSNVTVTVTVKYVDAMIAAWGCHWPDTLVAPSLAHLLQMLCCHPSWPHLCESQPAPVRGSLVTDLMSASFSSSWPELQSFSGLLPLR